MRLALAFIGFVSFTSPFLAAQDSDGLFRRAAALVDASRPAEAEELLGILIRKDVANAEARVLLGFLYLQRASLNDAEKSFKEALDLRPEHAGARLGLGMTWARKGLPLRASQEFEKILEDRSVGHKARAHWIYSLFVQGRDEDALREARETVNRFPHVADYHNILGFLYQARGRRKESFREFLRSVQLDPRNLPTYFSLIGHAKAERDWREVLEWADRALSLDGNHPLLYQEMAEAYENLGRSAEAEGARQEAERCYQAEILYTRACAARRALRDGDAESILRECVAANPRLSQAWADLGELLRRKHRLEEAQRAFLMALEGAPGNPIAHLGLAATFQAQGKAAEALAAYQRALGRGVATPDLHAGLASLLLDQGKAREAAAEMLRAVRALPDAPDLLSYLGYLHQEGGAGDEAAKSFAEALRLDPQQVQAHLGRGYAALSSGDLNLALNSFRRAAEVDPSNTEAWRGLIRAQRKAGLRAEAEASCRKCLARNSAETECREQLASLRVEASDFKEAVQEFQSLLRNGKSSRSVLDGLAFSLLRLGDCSQAIGLLEASLKRYGPDPLVFSNLGYAYRLQGDIRAAVRNYERARDLSPGDPERHHDLAFALYLARDYAAAVEPFRAALKHRPDWGLAHYNLAMTYWNLRCYAQALIHARYAQEQGMREADALARALTAQLSLGPTSDLRPQTSDFRPKVVNGRRSDP